MKYFIIIFNIYQKVLIFHLMTPLLPPPLPTPTPSYFLLAIIYWLTVYHLGLPWQLPMNPKANCKARKWSFFLFFFAILTWIIIENWYENERWNIILWNKFNWNPFPNILWKIWKFNYKELTIEIHRFPDHIYIHISM